MAKIKTIFTGHGNFATGIASSVRLLAGVPNNFEFIDFTASMDEDDVTAKLNAFNDAAQPLLVFTDLVGGTPYKCAATLAYNNSDQDIAVVAGCNLASILETMFNEYSSAADYAADLVAATNRGAQVLDLTPTENVADDFGDDDGI